VRRTKGALDQAARWAYLCAVFRRPGRGDRGRLALLATGKLAAKSPNRKSHANGLPKIELQEH